MGAGTGVGILLADNLLSQAGVTVDGNPFWPGGFPAFAGQNQRAGTGAGGVFFDKVAPIISGVAEAAISIVPGGGAWDQFVNSQTGTPPVAGGGPPPAAQPPPPPPTQAATGNSSPLILIVLAGVALAFLL